MKPALLVILILAGGGLSYWSFDTQAEFETVIKEKIELRDENTRQEGVLQKTEEERSSAEKVRDEWNKKKSENQALVDKEQETVSNLKTELETLTQNITNTNTSLQKIKDDLAAIGIDDPAKVIQDRDSLKADIETLNGDIDEMKTLADAAAKKVAPKEQQLAKLQEAQELYKAQFATNSQEYRVTEVNPEWNIVIINAGESSTLSPDTVLLVRRNNKNIAKLQVASKEKNQTIANVVKGSLAKGNRIEPGDSVFLLHPQG